MAKYCFNVSPSQLTSRLSQYCTSFYFIKSPLSISHHQHPSSLRRLYPLLRHGINRYAARVEPGHRILPSDAPPPGLVQSPLHWVKTRLERGAAGSPCFSTGTIAGASTLLYVSRLGAASTCEVAQCGLREKAKFGAVFCLPRKRKRRHLTTGRTKERLFVARFPPS
jgi:hypothetical protein